jgi:hypothetical protein
MKEKGDDKDGVLTGVDLAFVEKAEAAARLNIEEAQKLAASGVELCAKGDPRAGLSILKEAKVQADIASFYPSGTTFEIKEALVETVKAAQNLSAVIQRLFRLPNFFLKDANKEFEKTFKFKKGGSFTGSKKQQDTSISGISINWYFWIDKKVKCKNICLISVYHFRKKGKVVSPLKKGFKKEYIDTHTGRPGGKDTLPHDGADVSGFAIDTPFYDPANGLKAVTCPCYLVQYSIDEAGKRTEKGKHLGSYDAPGALKSGYVEYFETVAVCLDKKPYVILNSMKWRTDGNTAEILGKNGKPLKKGSMDQGDASPAFKRALLDWIKRAKKKHGIADIVCGKK